MKENELKIKIFLYKIISLAIVLPCLANTEPSVNTNFNFSAGTYTYSYSKEVNGAPEVIFGILTDHKYLSRLNSNVVKSEILSETGEPIKRLLKIRQCIFFFCFNLHMVEKVIESKLSIKSFILKDESNFSAGVSSWKLTKTAENKTLVQLEANQTPDFWIPPFIGPAIIKSVLFQELDETFYNLQAIVSR